MGKIRLGMLAWVLALTCLPLGGCLVMASSETSYGGKGRLVEKETLNQVVVGKTTKDWLVAVLGEPTETQKASDETEVLRYEYVETKEDSISIFLLFGSSNRVETRKNLYFEIKDGVVSKHWRASGSS